MKTTGRTLGRHGNLWRLDPTDQREPGSGGSAGVPAGPPPPPWRAGAEASCSLSAAVKRLKVLRRCLSRGCGFFAFCFFVSLLHQVHNAVTASQCLQLPPFRCCAALFFFAAPLSISLSGRVTPDSPPRLLLHLLFSDMRSRQPDKSDAVFLLFSASRPPTSFLSSVLAVHTVFPTYPLCSVCTTHTVAHTHRPQCSTHHNCSTLASFFFLCRFSD